MEIIERWKELSTGMQLVVGGLVGIGILAVVVPLVVILAAVIGSFVLGVGSAPADTTPQASFSFDIEESGEAAVWTITHDGGDTIQASNLVINVDGNSIQWGGSDEDVTAGDSKTVDAHLNSEIRVIYQGEEESATLAVDAGPEA